MIGFDLEVLMPDEIMSFNKGNPGTVSGDNRQLQELPEFPLFDLEYLPSRSS